MSIRCHRCLVSGRVQGVYFRGSTQRVARRLGVSGSATNLPDGRVEVVACGSDEALAELQQWLWQGPQWADVTDLQCEPVECTPPLQFTTG
jgi:acylphosphatase